DLQCLEHCRMDTRAFFKLCDLLTTHGKLKESKNMNIQEMVATFLYIIGHDEKFRVKRQLMRSMETVSRQFHAVLNVVLRLQDILLKKPEPVPENSTDESSQSQCGKKGGTKRRWRRVEDAKLVECLIELVNVGGWKGDNGTFKSRFSVQEKWMEEKLPGCGLKASPHIETLKKHYGAIAEMLGPECSGFGWDDANKCIIAD
ncbi:LOW QUALITY PROTEIN: hypothetical protein CFOL_v3_33012, partial [Cephalotus follicularis]